MINKIKKLFSGSKKPVITKKEFTGIEVYDNSHRVYANYQIKECEIAESVNGKILIIKVK
jgi:hypothetical protein